MAEIPKIDGAVSHALISDVLRHTRIVSSKQFCYNPTGIWRTDATPAPFKPKEAIGFHIVASGALWLDYDGTRRTLSEGDIVLLRTGWDTVESVKTPEFWTNAPYMTEEASRWFLQRSIKAIAFDFPQDYCIRHYVLGDRKPALDENTTH